MKKNIFCIKLLSVVFVDQLIRIFYVHMKEKSKDMLDTLLNKVHDRLYKGVDSDGKSNVFMDLKCCIEESFGRLLSENAILKEKLGSAGKKIELLETALKESKNEADRSHVICGALNNLDSVKATVGLRNEQRLELQKEISTLQQLQNIGICNLKDEDDLELMLGEMYFDNLATEAEKQCPLLTEIVKLLVTGKRDGRNTGKKAPEYKFKSAIQVILAVDDIRSQKTKSDFSTLFGLLLMSHGAGKTMLDSLEPFGLCKSYSFL